jgi:ATP-dependent Lon protease
VKVSRYIKEEKYLAAKVEDLRDEIEMTDRLEAKKRQLLSLFKTYIKMNEDIPEEILFSLEHLEELDKISDFVAAYLDVDVKIKQRVLQEWQIDKRINRILTILKKENRVLSLKSELDIKVRDKMVQAQRQMYLQEQLRIIQEELGEDEQYPDEISALKKKVNAAKMSKEAREKAAEELERLIGMPGNITIGTNVVTRGIDVKVDTTGGRRGLYVIVAEVPDLLRVDIQACCRTGRRRSAGNSEHEEPLPSLPHRHPRGRLRGGERGGRRAPGDLRGRT